MSEPLARPINILLVEDSPSDARLIREAIRYAGLDCDVHVVTDGVQALSYLRHEGGHSSASTPDLIVLDLNLPRKDGREVLADIKSDARLRAIPVVILTTSDSQRDIHTCYDLHSNCFIVKPVDLEQFLRTVGSALSFWGKTATLPSVPMCLS